MNLFRNNTREVEPPFDLTYCIHKLNDVTLSIKQTGAKINAPCLRANADGACFYIETKPKVFPQRFAALFPSNE